MSKNPNSCFFFTYFLVDYKRIDFILKIFFDGVLEVERLFDFTMYVVYVCELTLLF